MEGTSRSAGSERKMMTTVNYILEASGYVLLGLWSVRSLQWYLRKVGGNG